MRSAQRCKNLPVYLFEQLDKMKGAVADRGIEIIDLAKGNPDRPTPEHIVRRAREAVSDTKNHRYSCTEGTPELRKACSEWYAKTFNVELDPETEVLSVIGSREGIAHLCMACLDPGDICLIPDPCYPTYQMGTILSEAVPHYLPLLEQNDFLPDFARVPDDIAEKAGLMFLNYPNNPTGGTADESFFEEAIDFAGRHDIILCHDLAYAQIGFDGYKPFSVLQFKAAKKVGIEFYSLSKTYNMAGWRIGFAVGNTEVIAALKRVKSNLDTGIFQAVQDAAIEALTGPQDCVKGTARVYQRRRDILVDGLNGLGWKVTKPKGGMYVWAAVIKGYTSDEMTRILLEQCGVAVVPGSAYGKHGEGYLRMALVQSEEKMKEVVDRIRQAGLSR